MKKSFKQVNGLYCGKSPIVLFYFLDAYYLGLEKDYRNLEASFIKKLRAPEDCSSCVYDFNYTHADEFKKDETLKRD